MTKKQEIERLIGLLKDFSVGELKTLRKKLVSKRPKKKRISKVELQKLIKQNKSTKALSKYYKVSPRTITRRIKEYDLIGLRPKGRKRRP